VMTSPEHSSGTDRLAEVAAVLASELIVNVQGDEPLIAPDAIDAAVTLLQTRPDSQMSTLRRAIDRDAEFLNPAVVKVVVDAQGTALFFSRAPIPFARAGHAVATAWKHIGLYVYRRDCLLRLAGLPPTPLELTEGLEQLRALEHGLTISTLETSTDTIGVDTPEDLERVRQLVAADVRP
jgi:3-deoxy-manno-octulosonate cytidylyltransferase (CMP-KDO synthetase)